MLIQIQVQYKPKQQQSSAQQYNIYKHLQHLQTPTKIYNIYKHLQHLQHLHTLNHLDQRMEVGPAGTRDQTRTHIKQSFSPGWWFC